MLYRFKKAKNEAIQELEHCDEETAHRIMKDIVMTSFWVGFLICALIVIIGLAWLDHLQGKTIDTERIILLITLPIYTILVYLVNKLFCGIFWDGFIKKHVLPPPEKEIGQGISRKDEKLL